jgi:hypothetical protein
LARSLVHKPFLAIIFALSITIGSIISAGSASAATSGCLNPHCYSDGVYALGPHPGAHVALPLNNMASGSADGTHQYHISSEMWVAMDKADDHYIEAGIADGFQPPNNTHQCSSGSCLYQDFEPGSGGSSACAISGCGAYELFWSDTSKSGKTQYQYHHVVRFLSPNPRAKEYIDIYYSGGGKWTISFSGAYTYTGISTIESSYHQTYYAQWGAEYYGPTSNGECGQPTALGADMLGPGRALIPVEMTTDHIEQPFTGKASLSEWDWSLPGRC